MEEARMLTLEECVERGGRRPRTIWMEMQPDSEPVPVAFYAEQRPFLKFDAQDRVLMISVRADMYGQTWRCWDRQPEKTDWMPDRERKFEEILASADAGSAKKKTAKD